MNISPRKGTVSDINIPHTIKNQRIGTGKEVGGQITGIGIGTEINRILFFNVVKSLPGRLPFQAGKTAFMKNPPWLQSLPSP